MTHTTAPRWWLMTCANGAVCLIMWHRQTTFSIGAHSKNARGWLKDVRTHTTTTSSAATACKHARVPRRCHTYHTFLASGPEEQREGSDPDKPIHEAPPDQAQVTEGEHVPVP